ncbi:MAG: glycosyltransferase [Actinobacteria bacterium]|nr:glycosyltransferase [Actinomycetota bacterium]
MGEATSIVIPAYNEAGRFNRSLPRLREALSDLSDLEVIVVDDGSTDDTAHVAMAQLWGWDNAKVVRLPWNQGKGAAVKAGVAVAGGEYLVFMDADLSADLADLPELVAALDRADIALGSRSVAGSRAVYDSTLRRVQSKLFNGVACAMTSVVASDTQCGFKAFRADAAKVLFHLCQTGRFAFDVELLALAQLLGYRIVEVPVGWVEESGSSVRPLRDPILMFRDLMGIRRRFQRLERRVRDNGIGVDGPPAGIVPLAEPELVAGRDAGDRYVIDLTDRGLDGAARDDHPTLPARLPALPTTTTDTARF